MGLDNHNIPFYKGETADQRVTKMAAIGLEAMKECEYYLADDKLAIMITNDVTKSDWGTSECGMGFWNFDNPHDLICTVINHIQAIGEGYGVGIGVVEATLLDDVSMKDPLAAAIQRAMDHLMRQVTEMEQEKRNGEDQ